MGKKATTTSNTYTPTAEEKALQGIELEYAKAVSPNAKSLNDYAMNSIIDSMGTNKVDYSGLNDTAQQKIAQAQSGVNDLTNGVLPQAYQDNMEASIKNGVTNSMGNLLQDYGSRGVLNSSVTNKGIQGINDAAAQAMSDAYTKNVSALSGLYGQMNDTATSGITAGAAAQEAALAPATNLWNMSTGLNSTTTGALSALSGKGTTTSTATGSTSGLFGGILSNLAGNASLFGSSNSSCFTEETKVKTPDGDKEIKRVNVGDKVVCPHVDGTETIETVIEVMEPRYSDVYTLICQGANNSKNFVNTTLTQPILTADNNFVIVGNLGVGTIIKGIGKLISVIYSGERKVYDLKVTGENNYYANGFIAKGATTEWSNPVKESEE